jgi:hypothetical protein
MFFEPLLTGDVWWLVVNKRRRRYLCRYIDLIPKPIGFIAIGLISIGFLPIVYVCAPTENSKRLIQKPNKP